jgi:predicted Rdx family selenoprotein
MIMSINFDLDIYKKERSALKVTYCDECRKEWILTSNDIKQQKMSPKGEEIVLTYFVCPHCGKIYPICIDNVQTVQMKSQIEAQVNKLAAFKSRNKIVSQSQLYRVAKLQKLLKKEYDRLDALYNGKFYLKTPEKTIQE